MPRQREAAMQQTGQQPPMTQEQDVRTAQTPPCANGPSGSARQDGVAPPPRRLPGDDNDDAEAADDDISGEQLETLRRECLERSALTRVPRLPSVIDKARRSIKLEPPIFRVEESRVIMSNATNKADRSSLARSPSRSSQHSQRHLNHHHQEERHEAKVPSLILKLDNRCRNRAESEPPSFRPKTPPEKYSERPRTPELSPSPPPVQSKMRPVKHEQSPRTVTSQVQDESREGERDLACKKEEASERTKAGKCNYVLSDNYENLSGDESPVSRSLDASGVDHKAIELFLPLLDAMEKGEEKDDESVAAVQSLSEGVATDDYDDLPEEGSLVIDDECAGCDASETNAIAAADASDVSACEAGPATRHKWPLSSSSSAGADSPQETAAPSPTVGGEPHIGSRIRCVDECLDTSARRLLLKDQRTKKSKMDLLRKAPSADSTQSDDVATSAPPTQTDPLPAKKRGRKPNPRPAAGQTQTSSRSTASEQEDKGTRGARQSDDHGDGAASSSLSLRNGQRKRSRWKTAASQEDEDAGGGGGGGGSDSNNTVDYQLSSDEETSKGTGGSSDQPTPTPPPPPPAQLGAGGKKQRKNSEDHRRSSGSLGGEAQHGDESRYKRLAQELPGFNWLEQKIMGHGGANFSDAPPMPKHVTTRELLAMTAPTPHEKAEPKAAAPAPEVPRIYPPGTDILSRSMSEIQDDCCEDDADETPVLETVAVTPTNEDKAEDDVQQDEVVQEEMQRQMLVAAMPEVYQSDPRLSQVITSTAVLRPQYSLDARMTTGSTSLEMTMSTPSLTSAPSLACAPRAPDKDAPHRQSPEPRTEGMSQGRAAVEEQSSDSDVLYLGVSRKGSSPNVEHGNGDSRALLLSAAAKPLESPMSAEASVARSDSSEKPHPGAPEPINLSDSARRGDSFVAPRQQYSFFQPHAFVMADHQRWLEERRYQEMMNNARGQLLQPRHLPPAQMPPSLPQRRLSAGAQMMPSHFEAQQQYRAVLSERSAALQHSQPAHQGGPPPRLAPPSHQPAPSHHPQLSHQALQSPQSHQPPQSHQAQMLHPSPPSQQALQSHQVPPSQQAPMHHAVSHQAPSSHQAQLPRQVQMSHQTQQSHQTSPFYPMPRAHQAQPTNQPPQPLPALTHDDSPRNVRPDFSQAQQRYKGMDQTYGVNPQAQQIGTYVGPHGPKRSPEPAPKTVPPQGFNPYAKDVKADSSYKETAVSRIERTGPPALQPVPANAKPPSTSPHAPQGESVGHSSQTSNLKTEMEMLKGELKYLDALASQKEAEYEKVVHARAEKLRTLNQLEAKYKRSLEPPQSFSKEESRYPSSFEVGQGQSPSSQPDKASPSVEEQRAAPRQRSASSGGSSQQKQSPPSLPSPLAKTSPGHQPVPGLIPYSGPHPQQSRQPLPLPPQPSIPMNMPLIGAGMFSMRNMELHRDFAAMMTQSQNPAMMAGYGRPYYSLERSKHSALPPAEMPRPPAKRKYSPASASVPQTNGDARVSAQQPPMAQSVHRQREPEKVTAPLSQEHAQWLQAMKSRETQGGPPAYPANAQSAFQTYNPFPQRRLLAEDVPLNPAMTNATWSNYAEGLHERYAFQMSKHGLYGAQPAWGGLEKQHQQQQQQQQQHQQQQQQQQQQQLQHQQQQQQQQQPQQRSGDVQSVAPSSREHPAKRLSREEFLTHHQVPKERHSMRPDDKLVAHAQSMARQVPTHDPAVPHQPPQVLQSGVQAKNNTCVLCGQYAQYMCSGCQNVWYCGPQCQRNNWVNHSHVCHGTKR